MLSLMSSPMRTMYETEEQRTRRLAKRYESRLFLSKTCKDLIMTTNEQERSASWGPDGLDEAGYWELDIELYLYLSKLHDSANEMLHIKQFIHYPKCWDVAAYPTLFDAIVELEPHRLCPTCCKRRSVEK